MNAPEASQPSQNSNHQGRIFRLAMGGILAAAILGLAWMLWPAPPLNGAERRLVGTWRFQDPKIAGGKSYAYVFRNDRTMSGGIIQGTIPQSEWEGKWSIKGTDLSIKHQGINVPVRLFYQVLGRMAPDRPIPLVWNSEEEITLDRGNQHPEVLVRMRER